MKELTKAEEQIMQVVWEAKEVFVKDVIDRLPEPKPAYNTVATFLKILEKKDFISHRKYGNIYQYFPLVDKIKYSNYSIKKIMESYFGGSFSKMVSFFVNQNDISLEEFEALKKHLEEKNKQTGHD